MNDNTDDTLPSVGEAFLAMRGLLEDIVQIAENHGFKRGDDLQVWLSKRLQSAQLAQDMEPIGYRWRLPDGGIASAFAPKVIAEMRLQNGEPSQKLYDESQMDRVVMAHIDRTAIIEALDGELQHDDDYASILERIDLIADAIVEGMRP